MRNFTAAVVGAAVTIGTAGTPVVNVVLGGAAAGYVAEGDRREGVRAGAVAGALGNAVAGLLVGTVGYAFLSGLGGPVSTAAWLRGLAAVAGGTAVVLALAGAALGAAGARVPGGTDSD